MTKLERVRALLQKVLLDFERISTDKALLESSDEEIVVGSLVHGIDEDGNEFSLENGEYRTDAVVVYVVEDGKVVEIREEEKEETTGDDVQPEAVTEEEEVNAAETEPEAEPEAEPEDERIANLEAEIARLEEELGAARERISELERENEELKNKSAAPSATEEFEKITSVEKSGNKRIDALNRVLNA